MYLHGGYRTANTTDTNVVDLCAMKLDSSGNLLWDFAFNYPTSDGQDYFDMGLWGYVDAGGNLNITSETRGSPEKLSYRFKISPAGELLEQAHFEPSSAGHEVVWLTNFSLDPQGYLVASGKYFGELVPNPALLLRMAPDGTIDWINNWGNGASAGAAVETGLDG